MKIRLFAALVIALLIIPMMTGCSLRTLEAQLEAVEETIDTALNNAENAAEAVLLDVVAPATAPVTQPPARLTEEEAKAAALAHAGLTADQVKFSRTEFEYDDGRPEYEVEFRKDDTEYDYTIHAETGAVLKYDQEFDPVRTEPKPTETQPAAAPNGPALTREEAEAIALAHAGLTADQVVYLRSELDYDRGQPEYEVEFRVDRTEYDYEINADTGAIISWDKDWDD